MRSAAIFLLLWLSIAVEGFHARVKRQDWNFPGPVDNRDTATTSRPQTSSRPRPPDTPRPPVTQPPPPSTDGATLPPVGIVVFDAPCNRCMTTRQYNPVCGSDNRSYANRGILNCARTCGFDVTFVRLGVCETPR